jgi:Kef-type K+ transport system membrane component KefB
MIFLVSQFLFILFVLLGIMVWAASDTPLAWREIAMNTRRNPENGSPYTMLRVLSVCLKIFAVLLWIVGIAAIVGMNVAGSAVSSMLGSGGN